MKVKKTSLKKYLYTILSLVLCILILSSCYNPSSQSSVATSGNTSEFGFKDQLYFVEDDNGSIDIDLSKSESTIKEKYNSLYGALSTVTDIKNIGIVSTTTVNMLYDIGFIPKVAPESKSLDTEISSMLTENHSESENQIISIGSSLNPNIEVIVKNNVEMILFSDALPTATWMNSLKELGVKVQPVYQSTYSDMFVILQAFKDINKLDNSLINKKMMDMKSDLVSVQKLMESSDSGKKVALIQLMPESIYINGGDSVLNDIIYNLNLENIFISSESSELNVEEILVNNPDYLIIYGMGISGDLLNQTFENKFFNSSSSLSQLSAVKNNNYVIVGGDEFEFIGSIDFNIIKIMKQIAEAVYD